MIAALKHPQRYANKVKDVYEMSNAHSMCLL